MFTLDNLFLLLTGLVAAYLLWRFYTRWSKRKSSLMCITAWAFLSCSSLACC